MIEQGWSVLDATGNEIGKVDQITGDLNADIFDGITVGDGGTVLTRPKYVSSEHVTEIRRGQVRLDLLPEEAATLEDYKQPIYERLTSLGSEPEEASHDPEYQPESPFMSLLEMESE